jgi:hypothetical protein
MTLWSTQLCNWPTQLESIKIGARTADVVGSGEAMDDYSITARRMKR